MNQQISQHRAWKQSGWKWGILAAHRLAAFGLSTGPNPAMGVTIRVFFSLKRWEEGEREKTEREGEGHGKRQWRRKI